MDRLVSGRDEWRVNDLLCIKRGLLTNHVVAPPGCDQIEYTSEDRTYNGWPLRVLGVSMPFLTVQNLLHHEVKILDTRLYELMRITIEYAESIIPGGALPINVQAEKNMVFPLTKFVSQQ